MRLRCMRCGDWAEMDPTESGLARGVCGLCIIKYCRWFGDGWTSGRRRALWMRHRRDKMRHPTYRALVAALEAMEAVPHGTLVEVE